MRSWEVPSNDRSPADHLDILARTLFGEARSEALIGVVAVANVIMHRRRRAGWWGGDIASVCLSPPQFSCWSTADWNKRNLARMERATLTSPPFQECHIVARLAMADALRDVTGGATHYHTHGVKPRWASVLRFTKEIGAHKFYVEETWQREKSDESQSDA